MEMEERIPDGRAGIDAQADELQPVKLSLPRDRTNVPVEVYPLYNRLSYVFPPNDNSDVVAMSEMIRVVTVGDPSDTVTRIRAVVSGAAYIHLCPNSVEYFSVPVGTHIGIVVGPNTNVFISML